MIDHADGEHELAAWLTTPQGRYLLAWEQARVDQAVADVFGFHALQLGLPELDALRANRMPHRWCAGDLPDMVERMPVAPMPRVGDGARLPAAHDGAAAGVMTQPPQLAPVHLYCEYDALPFPNQSVDLVVLPHTLELARDPHLTLREVERVLVPEGRVVIFGFNPASLWGVRQRGGRLRQRFRRQPGLYLPSRGDFIGYWRLRDWLRLLSFEVEGGRFGCYRPPFESERWLQRFEWIERIGDRWWPVLGAVYFLVAVKRVRGMRLVGLVREQRVNKKAARAVVAQVRGSVK